MPLAHSRWLITAGLLALGACKADGPLAPAGGEFSLGQSLAVESGRQATIIGGTTGGEFIAMVANLALQPTASVDYSLRGEGVTAAASAAVLAMSVSPVERSSALHPVRDVAFEEEHRERERLALQPRFAGARAWRAARVPSLPRVVNLGDVVSVNLNVLDACTNATRRAVRVAAIGAKSLILVDTLNPPGGFTTADFDRYAARFDTLVYPLDVAAFGEPTDLDNNGRIAIVFTRAVNELTPRNSFSYVAGLTYSRDLFPHVGTPRAEQCAGSNEGEYLYLMTPDPAGAINGNRRSRGFVDSSTVSVAAHELQHLINASRKLYIHTSAPKFEEKFLDEGLAHIAEELLFYKESGLSPRGNLTFTTLISTPRIQNAYRMDMNANANRYRDYLATTAGSSPYATGDSLATRGAAWSLLRYLADRTGSADGDVWMRLANNSAVGVANLQAVFGRELSPLLRDWMMSHAVDDIVGISADQQQKSWNWRSVIATAAKPPFPYPLRVTSMTAATSYTGRVVAGGASYYKLAVPPNATATLTLGAQSGAAGSNLQLVIVRTQ